MWIRLSSSDIPAQTESLEQRKDGHPSSSESHLLPLLGNSIQNPDAK
jgi:hypothetical protein